MHLSFLMVGVRRLLSAYLSLEAFCAEVLISCRAFESPLLFGENIKEGRCKIYPLLYGRSEATRTPGLLVPNQARYQLRYTPVHIYYIDFFIFGKSFLKYFYFSILFSSKLGN